MRVVVLLLLLANGVFFAYTWLDHASGGDRTRVVQQVQPDKLKLLSMKEVAALSPGKAAQVATVCMEWGPFSDAERLRAEQILAPFQLGKQVASRKVETNAAFWVFIPPLANKAAADKKASELNDLGIKDYFLVQDAGPHRNAISLGVFKTEEAANSHLARLQTRGVRSAKVEARPQTLTQTLFVVYDPPSALTARAPEMRSEFPTAEMKAVACIP